MSNKVLSAAIISAESLAASLHTGVKYGMSDMYNQVVSVAQEIDDNSLASDKDTSVIAALLHKSMETKRLRQGVKPLTITGIGDMFGDKVASIIGELSTEPSVEGLSKEEENKLIAKWAEGLSPEAQEILLAEKVVNLRTSAENPNMKKPAEWHCKYVQTRMPVIDVLGPVNKKMYQRCLMYADQVIERFSEPQKVTGKNMQQPRNNQHMNG